MTNISKLDILELKSDYKTLLVLSRLLEKYDDCTPSFAMSKIEKELGKRTLNNG